MANPLKGLIAFAKANPIPIVLGVGGVAAVTSYQKAAEAADARRNASGPVVIAAGAPPGAEGALIAQGAGLASQAFGLGAAPTAQALDLAGFATGGAQALAATLAGSQTAMAGTLGSAFGTIVGAVSPMFERAEPAPTFTPAAPPPPAPAPTPSDPIGDIVRLAYRNILGRTPDADGYAYWHSRASALHAAGASLSSVSTQIHAAIQYERDVNGAR